MRHTRLSTYELVSGTFPELTGIVEKGILPQYEAEPGFVNFGLVDVGDRKVVSISMWETREQAQESAVLASKWINDNIADRLRLTNTQIGELALFRGMPVSA
jgi:hypothetical protein